MGRFDRRLQVRGTALDLRYLRRWCTELGLEALLERALEDARAQ